MTKTTTKTKKTFETLYSLHKMLGSTFPVSWAVYRQELVETYEMDGAILDALNRLGHFVTTPNTVRFISA